MLLASALVEEAQFWLTLVQIAVGLGAVAAVAAAGRYAWNRWRWRAFKRAARRWQRYVRRSLEDSKTEHPKELEEQDWRGLVEQMLTDSYFSPFETQQPMHVAEITARGEVASTIYW